jgi:hypothetical protein
VGVEVELGRVEEEDLADLRLEGVEFERRDGRLLFRLRDGQLQLDAVGSLEQFEQPCDLLVREGRPGGWRRRHPLLLSARRVVLRRPQVVVTTG